MGYRERAVAAAADGAQPSGHGRRSKQVRVCLCRKLKSQINVSINSPAFM